MGHSIKHIVSVSSGADSSLTLALALERHGDQVEAIYCDTGNEHDFVYEHLDYLETLHGIKIVRLKADFKHDFTRKRRFIALDQGSSKRKKWSNKRKRIALSKGLKYTGNAMIDLCQLKGRFPARMSQFCTQHLKVSLAQAYQQRVNADHIVISWQGVRQDESRNRADALSFEMVKPGFYVMRPIAFITKAQVFDELKRRGIKRNPLYDLGFSRVGCLPCINASKNEIMLINKLMPDYINKIREWERLVSASSKRGLSSFFFPRRRGLNNKEAFDEACIDETIKWAQTDRGGRQFMLDLDETPSEECILAGGACE